MSLRDTHTMSYETFRSAIFALTMENLFGNEWMNERKKNNSTNNTNWTNAVYECNLRLTGSLDGTYTQNLYANDTVWPQIENDTFLFRMMAATLFRTNHRQLGYPKVDYIS